MSWKPVIAGVDGTAESVRAAVTGAMVAQRAGTSCALVAAAPDYAKIMAGFADERIGQQSLNEARARDRAILTATLRGFVPDAMIDALEIRPGRAPIVLRDQARRIGAGTIVVGHRPHHGLERLRPSLVANLVRACDVPVLVVNGGSPVINRIMVGLDLSFAAEPVYQAARAWAELFGAKVRAVHVIEPMPVVPYATISTSDAFYRADEELRRTGFWSRIEETEAERVIRGGHAPTVLAAEAAEWGADLLVVGSHGRGWAERFLIGSTAEHLFQHPPVATLVVPVQHRVPGERLDIEALPWEERALAPA